MATAAIAQATERAAGRSLFAALTYQTAVNRLLIERGWSKRPMLTVEEIGALDFAYEQGISPAAFVDAFLATQSAEAVAQ